MTTNGGRVSSSSQKGAPKTYSESPSLAQSLIAMADDSIAELSELQQMATDSELEISDLLSDFEIKSNKKISHSLASDIRRGNKEAVVKWLEGISPGRKKEQLNTIKYIKSDTVLHLAADANQLEIAEMLMDEGADPNVKNKDDHSVLHIVCTKNYFDDVPEDSITKMVKALVERGGDVDAIDEDQSTPLHHAVYNGHTGAVRVLLEHNANVELKDSEGNQPIHMAANEGHHETVELLLQKNPECVHWKGEYERTPLHNVCFWSHVVRTAKLLLDYGADVNMEDERKRTALWYASNDQTSTELVKLLLENGAEVNPPDHLDNKEHDTPLQRACLWGCSDIVSLYLKHEAKIDKKALENAVSEGYEEIVKQLMDTDQWPVLLRHVFNDENDKETTPFREMIKKMPSMAEEILNKCTVHDPQYKTLDDESYNVVFNYEFVEDTRDIDHDDDEGTDFSLRFLSLLGSGRAKESEEEKYGCNYEEIWHRYYSGYSTSWGPVGFKRKNHPLAIMVQSKRLNLLTHPLVGSLLHHKWKKFGQYGYFINLLTYCVYLIFLTTFALIVENPRSEICLAVNINGTGPGIDCGIGTTRLAFIYISAIIVIIMAILRLVLEGIQLLLQFPRYFLDWVNWMEMVLFLCSIILVWVFNTDCLCPLEWQWQFGVIAVFLGWINLIIFISKFPLTGIYVLMFVKILYTFLKMLALVILLVLAFGITLYLTFTQPEILRSPFSTPAWSLLKMMSMTVGDFDFDSIFRLDPTGESDNAEEIPFPPISYILWIVFVVLMPILLTNMLVGLAVGDIQAVKDEAVLQKLALQVDQVLTVEELLPKKLRRKFISGYKKVYPNEKVGWRTKINYIIWGGERYDTRDSIGKVLHHHEDENEKIKKKTDKVLHEVENLKTSMDEIREMLNRISSKLEVDGLTSI